MKLVTIFFDLEGRFGAPFEKEINLSKIVHRILTILNEYKVRAVFNTCGALARLDDYAELVKEIHKDGHETSSHGYAHEDFLKLQPDELNRVLAETEETLRKITGKRIIGIRSPYSRRNKTIYSVLERRGYRWVSNRWIPRVEQLYSPEGASILNPRQLIAMMYCGLKWLTYVKSPCRVGQLLEIPQLSTNDCGFLGLPKPSEISSEKYRSFALNGLKSQFGKSEGFFNLNFHPWVIGSANRPTLLRKILDYINRFNVKYVLPSQLIELK